MTLDDIVATLSQAAQEGRPVAIRATPAHAQGTSAVIDTSSLSSLKLNAQAGVVSAGAGAEVMALNAEVDRGGYRVLGMPKNPRATHVGSLIATGEISRRALCGIRALLTTGEEVRAGGRYRRTSQAMTFADISSAVWGGPASSLK